ncbi:hypothetical protein [Catellatospora chokoriensis]|uniref:Uncharacterized protein n=1 Tax=Catellatospora chokoriensis TaxID=310353 RepID=A0A8J3K6X4_9ACTN|nr:hypothetical protein [Catellatospora chokoriensis]GIF89619.1 hypothetical protein Cch02nite_30630 [Catellatospora chokoriensis]
MNLIGEFVALSAHGRQQLAVQTSPPFLLGVGLLLLGVVLLVVAFLLARRSAE